MKISAVVITYNEEKRLEPALKSVEKIAEEIIVVDRFSRDDTEKIARKYTKKFYKRKWTNYADQKNYANSLASHSWILSLDADERLSKELQHTIVKLKETEPQNSAFSMPRLTYYLGRWIRHSGWYPDRKVRLFQKEKSRWEGDYVHENLNVEGKIIPLESPIHHFSYAGISDHLERINLFSGLGAQKLYARKKKARWFHMVFLPPVRFVKSYLFKAGFRDRFPGFVISVLHGYAIFARYAKLKEIWKKGEKIEPFPY
ncbi:MAG: glycosyltransferase family 2 protein [Candidatus Aminicenantes bacterium]|nr:glycosyltransferase family 2 protein [Candidatus Aminicenantes bacterium]